MEMGTKKNMRMLREAWAESNPAHCNERRRGKTRRGDTKHGFCVNRGWSWNRIMSANKGWNRIMSVMRGVQVRRCKNPPQGENLDKDQRQNKQYNYEQARSTRHAGRPADWPLSFMTVDGQNPATVWTLITIIKHCLGRVSSEHFSRPSLTASKKSDVLL